MCPSIASITYIILYLFIAIIGKSDIQLSANIHHNISNTLNIVYLLVLVYDG